MLHRLAEVLKQFHAPGGGFLTNRGAPGPGSPAYRVGPKVIEENTNVTGLAHKMRHLLYALAHDRKTVPSEPRVRDHLDGPAKYDEQLGRRRFAALHQHLTIRCGTEHARAAAESFAEDAAEVVGRVVAALGGDFLDGIPAGA